MTTRGGTIAGSAARADRAAARPADPPTPSTDAVDAADVDATRARQPDRTGRVEVDGGWVAWETAGAGDPPLVFVPPWQVVHSRVWKAQLPDFARRHRVVAWDARGNGRSDRPTDPAAHTTLERARHLGLVMDAAGVERAVLIGLSSASGPILAFADACPERVLGLVLIGPSWPFGESAWPDIPFEEPLEREDGWHTANLHVWRRDLRRFLDWFFSQAFPEPHSTKQREDAVRWGLETDPETLAATVRVPRTVTRERFAAIASAVRVPTLVIQGTDERISHVTQGMSLAGAIPGARLALLEGSGHIPNARDPVRVNLLIRAFLADLAGAAGGRR